MRIYVKASSEVFIPNSEFRIPNLKIRIPKSRQGMTLMEVLISMFVLAIGLMGVLALYPLGAAQMAQAVKDERTAQLAEIAEGMARNYWRYAYLNAATGSLDADAQVVGRCPELSALDTGVATAASSSPSRPLYIDPIGYNPNVGNAKNWVGGTGAVATHVLPRRTITVPGFTGSAGQRLRLFGLLDDFNFNTQGLANPVIRGHRYNSAWLLQRAKNNVRQEVNLKVVVYQSRSPDTPSVETHIGAGAALAAATSDVINVATGGLPLRKGSWILLATAPTAAIAAPPTPAVEGYADFYRVVGFADNQISVSPVIRHTSTVGTQAWILNDVVEVFDRGTITPFEVPAQ